MNPVEKYHIYSLLCAVILADNRILDVEIDEFVKVASGLQVVMNDPAPETEQELRFWFEDHHVGIRTSLLVENWQVNIAAHLKLLRHVNYKWQILQAMKSIAISDQEFHTSEIDILRFAVDFWNEEKTDYFERSVQRDLRKSTCDEPSNLDMFASSRIAVGE